MLHKRPQREHTVYSGLGLRRPIIVLIRKGDSNLTSTSSGSFTVTTCSNIYIYVHLYHPKAFTKMQFAVNS